MAKSEDEDKVSAENSRIKATSVVVYKRINENGYRLSSFVQLEASVCSLFW